MKKAYNPRGCDLQLGVVRHCDKLGPLLFRSRFQQLAHTIHGPRVYECVYFIQDIHWRGEYILEGYE